jgi:outer membrane protein
VAVNGIYNLDWEKVYDYEITWFLQKKKGGKVNYMGKILFIMVVLMTALIPAFTAQAQQSPFVIDNVPNIVGVAGGIAPDYFGSNDYQGVGAPFFRWTFEGQERYLQLLATELSLNVMDNQRFWFGPVLNYRFGRDDDVEDDVVKNMEK